MSSKFYAREYENVIIKTFGVLVFRPLSPRLPPLSLQIKNVSLRTLDLIKSEESPDSSLQDGGKKGGKIDKQNGGKILGGKMRFVNGASCECNITNFEEAAVSLSFALR